MGRCSPWLSQNSPWQNLLIQSKGPERKEACLGLHRQQQSHEEPQVSTGLPQALSCRQDSGDHQVPLPPTLETPASLLLPLGTRWLLVMSRRPMAHTPASPGSHSLLEPPSFDLPRVTPGLSLLPLPIFSHTCVPPSSESRLSSALNSSQEACIFPAEGNEIKQGLHTPPDVGNSRSSLCDV